MAPLFGLYGATVRFGLYGTIEAPLYSAIVRQLYGTYCAIVWLYGTKEQLKLSLPDIVLLMFIYVPT